MADRKSEAAHWAEASVQNFAELLPEDQRVRFGVAVAHLVSVLQIDAGKAVSEALNWSYVARETDQAVRKVSRAGGEDADQQ
jgi:hypothetical protein